MYIISLILIVVLTVIDQIIKVVVSANIKTGEIIRVIHFGDVEIFNLTHITNKGAAWSMMEGKTWFLVGFPAVVIIGAFVFMYFKRKESGLMMVSLALLISGGIGNLIDRIRLGEVVDYISFVPIKFPVFNFADICVVVGVILLAVYFLFFDKSSKEKKALAQTASVSDEENISEETTDE